MKLIVTIDTEEDNWARYSATDNPVTNIERIPALQSLFDEYGVRPTYLVSYPVATNPRSVEILRSILEQGKCEIGMHCHPWNTPPLEEKAAIRGRDTMLCNLPDNLIREKIAFLHYTISENFGITPVSFRAGRWGFSATAADALCDLGYKVESSVTPFVSWLGYQGPDYSDFGPDWFRFGSKGLEVQNNTDPLLEVPVSIGFLQPGQEGCRHLAKALKNSLARRLHIGGVLERMKLLNLVWLSPEMSSVQEMTALAGRMRKNGCAFLNLTFHSTSLKAGLSPFVQSAADGDLFWKKLSYFFSAAREAGWKSLTLTELEKTTSPRRQEPPSSVAAGTLSESSQVKGVGQCS